MRLTKVAVRTDQIPFGQESFPHRGKQIWRSISEFPFNFGTLPTKIDGTGTVRKPMIRGTFWDGPRTPGAPNSGANSPEINSESCWGRKVPGLGLRRPGPLRPLEPVELSGPLGPVGPHWGDNHGGPRAPLSRPLPPGPPGPLGPRA